MDGGNQSWRIVYIFFWVCNGFFRIPYNVVWSYLPPLCSTPPMFTPFPYPIIVVSTSSIIRPINSFFVLPIYFLLCGLPQENGWPTSGHTLREYNFSQQLSTSNSYWASDRLSYLPPFPQAWILFELSLSRPCAYWHNQCEFTCATVLLCL